LTLKLEQSGLQKHATGHTCTRSGTPSFFHIALQPEQ